MLWKRLYLTLEMIKFEHSVFALPFALTGALLGFRESGYDSREIWVKLLWIVVAMVGARSGAMAFNRLVDSEIDGRNPRTKMRHLPAGLLSRGFGWGFVAAASLIFVLAAGQLNQLCLRLAPLALGVVFLYSFTKRFTAFSHLVLGFSLGMAPAAAWIAVRGSLDLRILWLTAAVTFWTAGFDIIYACQDYEFDTAEGLWSVPRVLGIPGALLFAKYRRDGCAFILGEPPGVLGSIGQHHEDDKSDDTGRQPLDDEHPLPAGQIQQPVHSQQQGRNRSADERR